MLSGAPIRALTSRRRLLIPLLLLVVAVAAIWVRGADDRRVNDACGDWLEHRDGLRWVLSEADEAVGRAQAEGDQRARDQFNDPETALNYVETWQRVAPTVRATLDGGKGASDLERDTHSAFGYVDDGLVELHDLIEFGSPAELEFWIPEMNARFQNVDDLCLTAAR